MIVPMAVEEQAGYVFPVDRPMAMELLPGAEATCRLPESVLLVVPSDTAFCISL